MIFSYNGMNISYIVEGSGEDVIVLHGWGASVASVRPIINLLNKKFRVIALDMPGCGNSGEPQSPLGLNDYSALVTALARELGVKKTTLIGHSNGGLVTLKLNIENNLDIARNILIDSTGVRPKRTLKYHAKVKLFKLCKWVLSCPLWKKQAEISIPAIPVQ